MPTEYNVRVVDYSVHVEQDWVADSHRDVGGPDLMESLIQQALPLLIDGQTGALSAVTPLTALSGNSEAFITSLRALAALGYRLGYLVGIKHPNAPLYVKLLKDTLSVSAQEFDAVRFGPGGELL